VELHGTNFASNFANFDRTNFDEVNFNLLSLPMYLAEQVERLITSSF